jgi:hypothetical protein
MIPKKKIFVPTTTRGPARDLVKGLPVVDTPGTRYGFVKNFSDLSAPQQEAALVALRAAQARNVVADKVVTTLEQVQNGDKACLQRLRTRMIAYRASIAAIGLGALLMGSCEAEESSSEEPVVLIQE